VNPADLAFVAAVVLLTGAVQALAGFGFALVAVPILAFRLDVQSAIVLSTLTGTTANLVQSWQLRGDRDREATSRLALASLIGAPAGLALFWFADPRVLRGIVGAGVLLGVVVIARRVSWGGDGRRSDWLLGATSGVLLTSTSMNGPPLVVALQARGVSPASFRATLNSVFFVGGVVALGMYTALGRIDGASLVRWGIALPTLFAGLAVGTAARRFVSVEAFRRVVLALLAVSGLSSLAAALLA
jgi:uncharacterized membrane protein YfcA